MSHPQAPPRLDAQRHQIERLIEAGTPFLEVEEVISRSPITPDQKTELWALAWSLLGRERQRQHFEWIKAAAYSTDPLG